jgi:hypothetical protein
VSGTVSEEINSDAAAAASARRDASKDAFKSRERDTLFNSVATGATMMTAPAALVRTLATGSTASTLESSSFMSDVSQVPTMQKLRNLMEQEKAPLRDSFLQSGSMENAQGVHAFAPVTTRGK